MIESAKKLRELSPLLVEGRASRPFKPSNARPAFSTLPNPVILSGAGSSAKRMIQRSRRTPTLFGGCPWLLISPARQAPGVPNPSSTLRRVGVGMLTQRDEHTSNRRHRVPPLQRTQGQGTQVLTWGLAVIFQHVVPPPRLYEYRRRRSGAKVQIGCNDLQGADLSRRLLHGSVPELSPVGLVSMGTTS
jgi:hypothetical protein